MCLVQVVIFVTFLYFLRKMFLGKLFVGRASLGGTIISRDLSTYNLTRNIQFISNSSSVQVQTDVKRLVPSEDNPLIRQNSPPLCVLMSYLMSKNKHFMKYAQVYLDQGFDVITVKCDVWQVMWPIYGAQVVVSDLVTFLANNPQYRRSTMIHGFSGSAYVFGELLTFVNNNPEKYKHVVDEIMGQIWDSPAGFAAIAKTFGAAIFPNSKILQNMVSKYAEFHMKFFYESATKHYDSARANYENIGKVMSCPALFLCSKDDPVSLYSYVEHVAKQWEQKGINVRLKAWDKSPHCSHMWKHPEEYRQELDDFINKTGMPKGSTFPTNPNLITY